MGLSNTFGNTSVFLDTAPLIYYIEEKEGKINLLEPLFELNVNGSIEFITSTLTLIEVLVLPLRLENYELVDKYEQILTESDTITILDIDNEISREAAKIRAEFNYKTPDSIQLASALHYKCNYFLTNDKKLQHRGLKVITFDDVRSYI